MTFVARNQVQYPYGIAMNHKMNCFYVGNFHAHTISKITASGTLFFLFSFLPLLFSVIGTIVNPSSGAVSSFVGSGQPGSADGVGSNASFTHPRGIAVDQQTGNLYVCDYSNHLIRRITPQGVCAKTRCLYL